MGYPLSGPSNDRRHIPSPSSWLCYETTNVIFLCESYTWNYQCKWLQIDYCGCVLFVYISLVWARVVEQIIAYVRGIVQIMIQATYLIQIIYKGHPSRKKHGPRKISIWPPFSNMAAMGYPEILFFTLKGQQMVEKDNDNNKFYVLSIQNVQLML